MKPLVDGRASVDNDDKVIGVFVSILVLEVSLAGVTGNWELFWFSVWEGVECSTVVYEARWSGVKNISLSELLSILLS